VDHFVERRDTGLYVIGSRVPIDRIIWEYQHGEDPETIQSHYPTLTLEQVNGAITFYCNHKAEVEHAMEERKRAEEAYTAANSSNPEIQQKFQRMRRQAVSRRS